MGDEEVTNENTDTRERILNAARLLTQKPSTSNYTLNQLADQLDLHYTALYHYFKNRDELETELIERYCQRRLDHLNGVQRQPHNAYQQLAEFIRLEMHEPPTQLLSRGIDLFSEPFRTRATHAYENNRRELTTLIQRGTEDGSIRPCSAQITAIIILRILNRFANQHEQVLAKAGLDADALTEQIISYISHGILAQAYPAKEIMDRALLTFPSSENSHSNLELILRTLTRAFNDRGFSATSIPEVAASIGLSKTSLYRFAGSKEELLFLCSQRSLELLNQVRQISKIITSSPLEALLHNLYFERHLANAPPGPLLRTAMHQFLTPAHQRVVADSHTTTRYEMISLLERGISEGCFRDLNAQAVQPMLHAISLLRFTREENDPGAGLMDDIASFVLKGIANEPIQS